MNSSLRSDREKAGLRGPVKTVVDEYSAVAFDRNGNTLEWRGNTLHGRVERKYLYREDGRLIRIRGSSGDDEDEFRYHEHRKTQIRHVPARPDRQARAFGISAWFDSISEGWTLTDGGTIETTYNDRDEPNEKKLFDDEGTLLFRVVYIHDENGRLSQEKLMNENPAIPRQVRERIPSEQRASTLTEIRQRFEELTRASGLFGNADRTYVYNDSGQLAQRHMRQGSIRQDMTISYNEHGDISGLTIQTSGPPNQAPPETQTTKFHRVYEYDSFGNWTRMTETCELGGNSGTRQVSRQLTYHP